MSESTATTVAPTAAGSETAPIIPASVVLPAATETAPAAPAPVETSATPPAETPAPEAPAVAGVVPPEDAPREAEQTAAPVYTDFTFPEGVRADPDLLGKAMEVFGKHGLTQEAAQELIDLHSGTAQKMIEGYQAHATAWWNDRSRAWVAEIAADPQVGGNRFETSKELARAALSDGLNDADKTRLWADLTDTKIGDHPVLFKRMAQLGRERQQVLQLTGTATWAGAMKKLREPRATPPGAPTRTNGATSPAARRYQPRTNQGA